MGISEKKKKEEKAAEGREGLYLEKEKKGRDGEGWLEKSALIGAWKCNFPLF